LKILHLLSQKPGFTGSGYYLRALLKEAQRVEHQTGAVVGLGPGDEFELDPVFPVRFETETLPFPVVGMSDVMPYRSAVWSGMTSRQLQAYRAAFERVIREAVEEFQPDLLHCHHLWVMTALVRDLYPHTRIVASCHGTGLRQQERLPELAREIAGLLDQVDHIYFLTETQRQPTLGRDRSVVGAGFDPDIFHSSGRVKNRLPRLIYAGKLSYSKGCRELLEAVRSELGHGYGLSMAGAGHGPEAEEIGNMGRELGVEFLGNLSQEELAHQMRQSDVFVLPSYYEGYALVLTEALACGCRIVVNRLPGLEDSLQPELIDSGWVKLVEMPRLVKADCPVESDLPEYIERLRTALLEQATNPAHPPSTLPAFLEANSWAGVYERIARHYGANR
jgi:glycosyltransferase involved in cell wall biosynthesis